MKKVFIPTVGQNVDNYIAAMEGCGLTPVVSGDMVQSDDCGALLLPGGGDIDPARYGAEDRGSREIDRERDALEFALFDRFFHNGRPILGICRGCQVINVALGGTMIQDLPGGDVHTYDRAHEQDRVHAARFVHPVLTEIFGERAVINSAHHQAADRLGEGLIPAAFADDGVVEGLIHENGRVIGLQFHPERMAFAKRRDDAADSAPLFTAFAKLVEDL